MAKPATLSTAAVLIAAIGGITYALIRETTSNPMFRAADYDSLAECLAAIPADWLPGSAERTGAETACRHTHAAPPVAPPATLPHPAGAPSPTALQEPVVRPEDLRAALSVLAVDSLEGRRAGTPGAAKAARFIAAEMHRHGLEPGGDDGYLQRVPLAWVTRPDGTRRLVLPDGGVDTIPADRRADDVNVIGVIRGSDPALRDEAVIIAAHFDHVGIRAPDETGDSIYNGADDDASGVVALLEIARAIRQGPAPKRTLIFLAATAEESGMLGTRWYIENPVIPMERTVANLSIEMIGRPDSLAGGPGKAWLTGYDRSTMGDALRAAGIPIVPDPRPEQNFFLRSDNAPFAFRGIPAHTLSSYNMHGDYHRPSDEVDRIDFDHMARVVEAAIRATRILADGEAPTWKPGGRPEPPQRR